MKKLIIAAAILWTSNAVAAEPRVPFTAQGARSTEIALDRYDHVYAVERVRTPGRAYATFSAEPAPIEAHSVMLFEIHSASEAGALLRWRCVAVDDVSECLGERVRIRYVVGDEKMVLTMSAAGRDTPAGATLRAEARQMRTLDAVARLSVHP